MEQADCWSKVRCRLHELQVGSTGSGQADLLAEQRVEGFGELSGDGVRVVDQDALEERLVELSTKLVRCGEVGALAILDEGQGKVMGAQHPIAVVRDGGP